MKKVLIIFAIVLLGGVVMADDGSPACSGGPPGGGGSDGGSGQGSGDPNEMCGPLGVGNPDAERFVKPGEPMTYTVYFENVSTATAAAADVYVTNPLSEWLDWSTFEMGEIAFKNQTDLGLVGKNHGSCDTTIKGTNFLVRTELGGGKDGKGVIAQKGVVRWHLRIVDPTTDTGNPKDILAGLLQPNDDTHRGEGHLTYRIKVRDDAPAGIVITNKASIVFDYNDSIETDPAWWNTVGQVKDIQFDDGEGGSATQNLIVGVPYGEKLTAAPENGKPGYTFAGWYTGPNGTGRHITAESLVEEGDNGLYASWTANKYVVKFHANGGDGYMTPQTNEYDTVFCLASNAFTRVSYRFLGWATNETGEVVYEDGVVVSNMTAVAGGVVDLYAVWEWITMEVSFDANGGAFCGSQEAAIPAIVVTNGVAYGALPEVAWTGYAFDGWSNALDAGSDKVTAETIVTNDASHTLYAQWTANEYTLTFDANGGSLGTQSPTKAVTYDSAVGILPVPTRTGYTYGGWHMGGEEITAETIYQTAGDATATAYWTANDYTVEYNSNGGEGEMLSQTNTYDLAANLASNAFTRTSHRFLGWATNETGEAVFVDGVVASNLTAVAGGSVTLYAVWELMTVEVSFDSQGGAPVPTNRVLVVEAPYCELPDVSRAGFTFVGWWTGPDGTGRRVTAQSLVESGDGALYACWLTNAYTVRFDANGGDGSMSDQVFRYGEEMPLDANAFHVLDCRFTGWSIAPDGDVVYADGEVVSNVTVVAEGVVTLYAQWTHWDAVFVGAPITACEGANATIRVLGGNADKASSVKVYLTYNTAAAADVDQK